MMLISELIEALQEQQNIHGDQEVLIQSDNLHEHCFINEVHSKSNFTFIAIQYNG